MRNLDCTAQVFVVRYVGYRAPGEVAEWSKVPHSKCGVLETGPRVRIPPSPHEPETVLRDRSAWGRFCVYCCNS